MTLLAVLTVTVVAVACLEGWGRLVAAAAARVGARTPWDLPGVRGAIGVAVLSLVAGLLVMISVPARVPLVVLALVGLAGWILRPPRARLDAGFGVRAVILLGLGLWVVVWTLAEARWHVCDDDIAYLPMGVEPLDLGGLDQPFSQRRIGTLGAWLPLEWWGYVTIGPRAAVLGDTVICPLLAAAAVLWAPPRRLGLGLAVAGAAAVVAMLGPLGRANLGPNGVTALMILASSLVAMRSSSTSGRDRLVAVAIAGVLASQLLGSRLHYGLVALAPVAILVLGAPRSTRLRALGVALAALVAPLLGWSAAQWAAAGTPLFPVLGSGTLNPDWQGYRDPLVSSFGAFFGRTIDLLAYRDTWVALAVTIAVGLVLVLLGRSRRSSFLVPLTLALAAAATIVVYPVLLSTSATDDSWRLTRPIVAGVVLVVAVALAQALDERARHPETEALTPAIAAVGAAAIALWLGQVPWADVVQQARSLQTGLRQAADFEADPYRTVRAEYRSLKRSLPPDAVVAHAVDEPALLADAGGTAYNLDIIGANSLDPGLPFFAGANRKLAYLRARGVTHLVTVDPARSACLYRLDAWERNAAGGSGRVYQLWAPWFMDWFADAEKIVAASPTRRFGKLRVTALSGARAPGGAVPSPVPRPAS